MTGVGPVDADEGGEAPCFAHLLGDTAPASAALLAELVTTMADAVGIADEARLSSGRPDGGPAS